MVTAHWYIDTLIRVCTAAVGEASVIVYDITGP